MELHHIRNSGGVEYTQYGVDFRTRQDAQSYADQFITRISSELDRNEPRQLGHSSVVDTIWGKDKFPLSTEPTEYRIKKGYNGWYKSVPGGVRFIGDGDVVTVRYFITDDAWWVKCVGGCVGAFSMPKRFLEPIVDVVTFSTD